MRFYCQGFYGSGNTPCTVVVSEDLADGGSWYCVEGSVNVNKTFDMLGVGVDVETLQDVDCFTAAHEIETLDELDEAIAS